MGLGAAPSHASMGYYLSVWGIFTFGLWLATLKMSKALIWLFATVVVLFFLLAAANFTESHVLHTIAGIEGIVCGFSALYIAIAELLHSVYGKKVLPIA